jgi:Tfp pilus assembly protein PilW
VRRDAVWQSRPGISLVELLLATVLGSVVMIGVLTMFIAENQRLSLQRELSDAWLTLRSATELLAYDLRQASATGGDLTALTDTSFTIRARRGAGVICRKATNLPTYAITAASGEAPVAGDSVQVMSVQSSPVWKNLRVTVSGTPASLAVANCVTPSVIPSQALTLAVGDTANLTVGSPLHVFRSTQYGIMTSAGRRWLGRRVSGGSWEVLAGPLRTDGFRITYYNAAGAATTTASTVVAARITLRSESYGRTNQRNVLQDTMSLRIQLRN